MPKVAIGKTKVVDGTLYSCGAVYDCDEIITQRLEASNAARAVGTIAPEWVRGLVTDVYYRRNAEIGSPLYVSVNVRLRGSVAEIVLPAIESINAETVHADQCYWMNSDGTARIEKLQNFLPGEPTLMVDELIAHATRTIERVIVSGVSDYYLNFLFMRSKGNDMNAPAIRDQNVQTGLARLYTYLQTVVRTFEESDSPTIPIAYGRHTLGQSLVYYERQS